MATVNLGRIKPVFRGAYSGSTAYVVDDIVTHSDETYICIQAHGAGTQAVTQTAYWTKMAAKGTNGTDLTTTLTTQGDLVYRDGSGLQRLGAGVSGQVLQTGGANANPSWVSFSSGLDHLQVVHSTGQQLIDTVYTKLTSWDTPLINDFSSAWNSSNGEFTPSSNGSYLFNFHLSTGHGGNNTRYLDARIYVDGSFPSGGLNGYKRFTSSSAIDGMYSHAFGILNLTTSNVISFYGYGNDQGNTYNTSEGGSRITIIKVK